MYRLATKRTEKNEWKKTRSSKRITWVFRSTDNHACTGLQRITYCWELDKIDIANFARHAWVDCLGAFILGRIALRIPAVRIL